MSASDPLPVRPGSGHFVGRSAELDALDRDLRTVPRPPGPVRLLRGVAGVGKTRLAEELTRRAQASGITVAWGHNPDELTAPPYWPWTQVVRSLLGLDRGTELASLVTDDPNPVDRFELFDATAAVVRDGARDGPLLIVLDDLHAADHATLQLTRFLVRQLNDVPLLLVATVQTSAVEDPVVAEHLEFLARRGHQQVLGGLPSEAVGELLKDKKLAEAVHGVTGGNPLHVHQISGALADGRADTVSPAGNHLEHTLRQTVRGRVLSLDPTTRAVLGCAAVLGPVFDRRELAVLVEPLDPEETTVAITRLAAEGLVTDTHPGRFRHDLVAEVSRAELPEAELHRLHHRAANLIGADPERAGEVAHHLLAAGPSHRTEAVALSIQAGALASAASAHEDAVLHLTRALHAIDADAGDSPDGAQRLNVLLDLGAAQWRAGQTAEADASYEAAWTQGLALGDPDSLARAVLRNGLEYYFADNARPTIASRVEKALAAQPPEPSPTRARLLAELATHHLSQTVELGRDLAEEAVTMARRFEDPLALGNALIARQVTDLGPATLTRRIADGHEILACSRDAGDYRLAMHGRFLLMVALLEEGDIGGLDGELLRHNAVTEDLGEPRFDRFALWLRATRAMLEGDIATAEAMALQAFDISGRLGDPDAFGVYGGQIGVLLWMQGRVLETEPVYAEMRAAEPHEPLWPSVLAWLAATHGQPEAARGALAAVPDPAAVPSGMHWLLTATTYAEVAASVGTDAQVEAAWNALVPYAERMVPVAMGAAVWGTVAKPLGHLALRRGHLDEGISYLRTAVRTCARLGARPWMIDAQLDLADAIAQHRPGDPEAAELREQAATGARRLGLDLFTDRLEAASADPAEGSASTATELAALSGRPTEGAIPVAPVRPRVRVIGGFEVHDLDGTPARWKSRKARELLKILVSRRGAPVSRETLMELLWPDDDPAVLANRLSVALSTVRRALDPTRSLRSADLISTSHDVVFLNLEVVEVDLESFLDGARRVLARSHDPIGAGDGPPVAQQAEALLDQHRGEALPDEPHADWATAARSEVRMAMTALARLVASDAERTDDPLRAVAAHHRILDIDPYDEAANLGLTTAFRAMGAHGQAEAAYATYTQRMAELGVPVTAPFPTESAS